MIGNTMITTPQTMPYYETINTPYVSNNGTYQKTDQYFSFVYINKIYRDREYIYDLYSDNKFFKKEELEAEEKIIEANSISLKSNFFDYYE